MFESGEEVEYQLVCGRTGEVVGMAYIRPQEEANLHNLLLGPEEELGDVKKEENVGESEKTSGAPETKNISVDEKNVLSTDTELVESEVKRSDQAEMSTREELVGVSLPSQMGIDEATELVSQAEVKGPNSGLRQGKGDLGAPGLFGWQREVVYDEHTRCGIPLFSLSTSPVLTEVFHKYPQIRN